MRFAAGMLLGLLCAHAETGTFRGRPVHWEWRDGLRVTEGDIVLDRLDDEGSKNGPRESSVIEESRFRWPEGRVPYSIDPAIPNPQRVRDAIAFWNANTPIRMVEIERSAEPDAVRFVRLNAGGACSSNVGRIRGEQRINTDDGCTTPTMIHEIGHAVGLFHTQSRIDRDRYVRVLWENIDKSAVNNFEQAIANGSDSGAYDFGGVMHYTRTSFAVAPQTATLETVPAGIPLRADPVMSAMEIAAVRRMYGAPAEGVIVASNPSGLEVLVDGETCRTPCTYAWEPGSTHRIEAPGPQGTGNIRHVFGRWSDEGEAGHEIVAEAGAVYTANFIRQIRFRPGATGPGRVEIVPAAEDGYYPEGTIVRMTAIPEDGAAFVRWSGTFFTSHGISLNPLPLALTNPALNYIGTFVPRQPVRIETDPPNLAVTVDGQRFTAPVRFDWAPGTEHTVAVEAEIAGRADTRYRFQEWSHAADRSTRVTAAAGATFTARFRTQHRLNLTRPSLAAGTVTIQPDASDGYYDAGARVTLTANPAAGWSLANWTGDLTGRENSQSLLMTEQRVVGTVMARVRTLASSSVVNAASLQPGAVAPGQYLVIFGAGLGPEEAGERPSPDTRVLFDGVAARVLRASAREVAVVVPEAVRGRKSVSLVVEYQRQQSNAVTLSVMEVLPAVFAGSAWSGVPGIRNEDGTTNAESLPALPGSEIAFFVNGAGAERAIAVDIAGAAAEVLEVAEGEGAQEGLVRVRARVPAETPPGLQNLRIFAGPWPGRAVDLYVGSR